MFLKINSALTSIFQGICQNSNSALLFSNFCNKTFTVEFRVADSEVKSTKFENFHFFLTSKDIFGKNT